jgi:DNA (cytosine-5)-methyltransferase 1
MDTETKQFCKDYRREISWHLTDLGLKKKNPLMTQGFCFVPSLAADNCGLSILVNHYAHTTNGKTINPLSMPNIRILDKSILVTLKVGQSVLLINMKWDYPLPRLHWNSLGRLCNVMVDKQCLNELALFAGAGGGVLGGHLLGWRTVCAVEWEAYPASVLVARQNDGILPPFPIWDDVQTFDGHPWRGVIDVISGGFPCQDISAAGKGAGIDGERSGMWGQMARIIHEVRPKFVFVENSPMLTSRGLGRVLGDLANMGFDAEWGVLGHDRFGGQHRRDRIWITAYTCKKSFRSLVKRQGKVLEQWKKKERSEGWVDFVVGDDGTTPPSWRVRGKEDDSRPIMWRSSDGMADGVDRIAAIGNGQVPRVAAAAWSLLNDQN